MPRHIFTLSLCLALIACAPTVNVSTPTANSFPGESSAVYTPTPQLSESPLPQDIYKDNLPLFDYDKDVPVSITEYSVEEQEGYVLHDISYSSPLGGEVTAYFLVPDGTGPFAGVLLMHGSSGSRESLLPFARDLVLTGAIVMTIDGPAARLKDRNWLNFTPQDREEQIQLIIDLRRGADVLIEYGQADPDRLGYVGYSYGAAMGGLLAGVEHRIKAYGLMVGDGGLVTHFLEDGKPVGGFETLPPTMRETWLKAMEPIEPIHFIGHASPAWLYFQNAHFDSSVSEADALAYQEAGSLPKRVQWYDSGHALPSVAYVDMVNWLAERVGIDDGKFTGAQ